MPDVWISSHPTIRRSISVSLSSPSCIEGVGESLSSGIRTFSRVRTTLLKSRVVSGFALVSAISERNDYDEPNDRSSNYWAKIKNILSVINIYHKPKYHVNYFSFCYSFKSIVSSFIENSIFFWNKVWNYISTRMINLLWSLPQTSINISAVVRFTKINPN